MISDFWESADKMLAEAAHEGCRWTQLATWIYWQVYDRRFPLYGDQLFAAAAARASREALAAQKEILAELRGIIAQEIWAIDPDFCERNSDAPWNQPWRWKRTTVSTIAEIVNEYLFVEREASNENH